VIGCVWTGNDLLIVWINGAFGAGKTTVAKKLCKKLEKSFIYDPEQVGYFLWDNFPPEIKRKGNFQHIPMWREFNAKILLHLAQNYDGTILVPMALYTRQYYDEIIGTLQTQGVAVKHFILMASDKTLEKRIRKRGRRKAAWPISHIQTCQKAFSTDIPGCHIDTDTQNAEGVAREILGKIAADM